MVYVNDLNERSWICDNQSQRGSKRAGTSCMRSLRWLHLLHATL